MSAVPIQQQVVGGLETQSDSIEHLVPPFKLTESGNGTNGFMLVGDSGETESLSHHLKVREDLAKILERFYKIKKEQQNIYFMILYTLSDI